VLDVTGREHLEKEGMPPVHAGNHLMGTQSSTLHTLFHAQPRRVKGHLPASPHSTERSPPTRLLQAACWTVIQQ
jgi:hypothetical protein